MKYDPEHSKLIREIYRADMELPVASSILWNYGSRNPKLSGKGLDGVAERIRPGFRTYPQIVKDAACNFLRSLHRHTIGRFLGDC